ncbi:hypothetical protein HanHA300_Chr01g0033521 [Helianthus annuus]|nr:hypothetical protein HanHA300_Chr01g0033521 [Helianthus annuus]KAJ0628414.1 hypothetical protein HanHA89_Chr01g0036311 [Helianthus annuus]
MILGDIASYLQIIQGSDYKSQTHFSLLSNLNPNSFVLTDSSLYAIDYDKTRNRVRKLGFELIHLICCIVS